MAAFTTGSRLIVSQLLNIDGKIDKILTICALWLTLIWLSFSACNTIALFNCESDCEIYEERGLLSISLLLQALGFLAVIRGIIISVKKK